MPIERVKGPTERELKHNHTPTWPQFSDVKLSHINKYLDIKLQGSLMSSYQEKNLIRRSETPSDRLEPFTLSKRCNIFCQFSMS